MQWEPDSSLFFFLLINICKLETLAPHLCLTSCYKCTHQSFKNPEITHSANIQIQEGLNQFSVKWQQLCFNDTCWIFQMSCSIKLSVVELQQAITFQQSSWKPRFVPGQKDRNVLHVAPKTKDWTVKHKESTLVRCSLKNILFLELIWCRVMCPLPKTFHPGATWIDFPLLLTWKHRDISRLPGDGQRRGEPSRPASL